jgi:hypothetical protein
MDAARIKSNLKSSEKRDSGFAERGLLASATPQVWAWTNFKEFRLTPVPATQVSTRLIREYYENGMPPGSLIFEIRGYS